MMIPTYEKRLHLAGKQIDSAQKTCRLLVQLAEAFRVFDEVRLKELYSQVEPHDVLVGIAQEVEKL